MNLLKAVIACSLQKEDCNAVTRESLLQRSFPAYFAESYRKLPDNGNCLGFAATICTGSVILLKAQAICGRYRNYASDLGGVADTKYSGEVNCDDDDETTKAKEGRPKQMMQKKVTASKKRVTQKCAWCSSTSRLVANFFNLIAS